MTHKLLFIGMAAAISTLCFPIYALPDAKGQEQNDLKLREWRIAANLLEKTMQKEFAGRGPVVMVSYSGEKSAGKSASLRFATHNLHLPLDSFIPPYIGITAKQVVIFVYPVKKTGYPQITLDLLQRNPRPPHNTISKTIHWEDLKPKQWTEVKIDVDTDIGRRLAEVTIGVVGSSQTACEFYLADPRIVYANNQYYDLLSPQMPRLCEGIEKDLVIGTPKALPQRGPLVIGISDSWWLLYNAEKLDEISQMMVKYFPEYDIVFSCGWSPEPELAQLLPKLPPNLFYQFQRAQHDLRYLAQNNALPLNGNGEAQKKRFNSILATHPILQNALQDQVEYAASLGVTNFAQFDYVWPYIGTSWGYGADTVTAFRDDLSGRDEGLFIRIQANDASRIIHFWDYYADNRGMRFTPADLGLKTWDEYFPVTEAAAAKGGLTEKRNFNLFMSLCSYEWLRQAQRYNNWSKTHGGTHDYILNGESWPNANDHVYLMRLVDTGIIYPEYFRPYPILQEKIFRNQGYYIRSAHELGKKIGYCTELGDGGMGQPYWDLRTSYVVSYALAALGFDSFHNDFLSNGSWNDMVDPNAGKGYYSTRLNNLMAQGLAFRQAKVDEANKRPAADILNVSLRSVGYNIPGFLFERPLIGSWESSLIAAQINYEQTDPLELPRLLKTARVIFYAPPVSRPDIATQIEHWLAEGGKTFVTHSGVPFSHDEGRADLKQLILDPMQQNGVALFRDFAHGEPFGVTLESDTKGNALLSLMEQKNGSRIYYLHSRPEAVTPAEMTQVMSRLKKELNLPILKNSVKSDSSIVTRYENKICQIVPIWNRSLINPDVGDWDAKNHRFGRTKTFDPSGYLLKWHQPGAYCHAEIPVKNEGAYRIYRFLEDSEEVTMVGPDKVLNLTLSNVLTDICYFAEDSEVFQKYLVSLKESRSKLTPFLLEAVKQ